MKKKTLSILTMIVMLLSIAPAAYTGLAAQDVSTVDFYVQNMDRTENADGTQTFNRTIVIEDGVARIEPLTFAASAIGAQSGRLNVGNTTSGDGRYTATLDENGIVVSVERNWYDGRMYSAAIEDGKLKLGYFLNDDRYSYDENANVYLYEFIDNTPTVQNMTLSGYAEVVEGYPGSLDWNDEITLFFGEDGCTVSELFVVVNSNIDAVNNVPNSVYMNGWGIPGKKFEFVGTTVPDEAFAKYNITDPAVIQDLRNVDGGLYNPLTHGADADKKYPLFVHLHGSSNGRSEQWLFANMESAMFAMDDTQANFEAGAAYILLPRANEHVNTPRGWGANYRPALIELINAVIGANPNIDTNRIYVSGFSAGGNMTWILAEAVQSDPDVPFKFAAAVPIAAAGSRTNATVDLLLGELALPVWMINGYNDPLVSFTQQQRNLVNLIKTYANPALNGDNARVTVNNTTIYPTGFTPMQHWISSPPAYNMIYAQAVNGGKTPNPFVSFAEVIATPGKTNMSNAWPELPVSFTGPEMYYYGGIYDLDDPRYEIGANPEWSSFSNNGTLVDWLNMWCLYHMESASASASVKVVPGSQNELTITVVETYCDATTQTLTATIMIPNNSSGVFEVEGYKVFVDTKGNDQIRACYIVD